MLIYLILLASCLGLFTFCGKQRVNKGWLREFQKARSLHLRATDKKIPAKLFAGIEIFKAGFEIQGRSLDLRKPMSMPGGLV
jgi:hypothetical protein